MDSSHNINNNNNCQQHATQQLNQQRHNCNGSEAQPSVDHITAELDRIDMVDVMSCRANLNQTMSATSPISSMDVDDVDMDVGVANDKDCHETEATIQMSPPGVLSQRNENSINYCVPTTTSATNLQQQQQFTFTMNSNNRHSNGASVMQANIKSASNKSDILIVTNVDMAIFSNAAMRAEFERLFLVHDPKLTFRYLKSFRRVRLDFTSVERAECARKELSRFKLGDSEFRCYAAHIIKPSKLGVGGVRRADSGGENDEELANKNDIHNEDSSDQAQSICGDSIHLNVPKPHKQFLISPPASPPVGWEPVHEASPCIDVQLISAIANLCPGKVHEIHPGNESQPGIFVEVCEDGQFEATNAAAAATKTCARLPRTMSPYTRPQAINATARP